MLEDGQLALSGDEFFRELLDMGVLLGKKLGGLCECHYHEYIDST